LRRILGKEWRTHDSRLKRAKRKEWHAQDQSLRRAKGIDRTAELRADQIPFLTGELWERAQRGRRALYDQRLPPLKWDAAASKPSPRASPVHRPRNLLNPRLLGLDVQRLAPEAAFGRVILPRIPTKDRMGLLFVDVGANRGQFALQIARAGMQGLAFEPSPSVCADLTRRVQAYNKLRRDRRWGSVDVRCAAVGGRKGLVYLRKANASASNMVDRAASVDPSGKANLVPVPVVRLDDVLPDTTDGFMLKTDTQGFEHLVLAGAKELLARRRARLLLVELSEGLLRAQGSSPFALMSTIADHGYDCTHLRFFGGRRLPSGKVSGPFGGRAIPHAIVNQSTIPFEQMAAILPALPGWTDLLCWW
jgi:FkbM family methyltransferase